MNPSIRLLDAEQFQNTNLRLPNFFGISNTVRVQWTVNKKPKVYQAMTDYNGVLNWVEIIERENGGPYLGQFDPDRKIKVGVGIYLDSDGSIREGNFRADKQVSGVIYSSKNFFGVGTFNQNGELEGTHCCRKSPKGELFIGKFINGDIKSGQLNFNRKTILGTFKNFKPVGKVSVVDNRGIVEKLSYGEVNDRYLLQNEAQIKMIEDDKHHFLSGKFNNGILEGHCYNSSDFEYVGNYFLGVPHGYGEIYLPKSLVYFGNFKFGRSEDTNGQIYYFNGFVYEGGLTKYLPEGKGKLYDPNGWVYEGIWKKGKLVLEKEEIKEKALKEFDYLENNKKYSKEIIIKGTSSIVIGYFKEGDLIPPNGVFSEYFINSEFCKSRVLDTRDSSKVCSTYIEYEGIKLEGEINQENIEIDCVAEYINGSVFTGIFNLEKMKGAEGYAKFMFCHGITFEGKVSRYLPHGKGKIHDHNRNIIYEGEWKNGVLRTEEQLIIIQEFSITWVIYFVEETSSIDIFYGTGYYCNGAVARGTFVKENGKLIRNGKCDFSFQDTNYVGEYKDDLPHGNGTCSTSFLKFTGTFDASIWKKGIVKIDIKDVLELDGCFFDVFEGPFTLNLKKSQEVIQGVAKKGLSKTGTKELIFRTQELIIDDLPIHKGKKIRITNKSGLTVIETTEKKGILNSGETIIEQFWKGKLQTKSLTKNPGQIKYGECYEASKKYKFKGFSKFGFKCGKGNIFFSNGEKYEGDWFMGMKHGLGKISLPDGTIYEGSFKQNKLSGFGRMILPSGDRYEGLWLRGYPHGKGSLFTKSGNVIEEGDYVQGVNAGQSK